MSYQSAARTDCTSPDSHVCLISVSIEIVLEPADPLFSRATKRALSLCPVNSIVRQIQIKRLKLQNKNQYFSTLSNRSCNKYASVWPDHPSRLEQPATQKNRNPQFLFTLVLEEREKSEDTFFVYIHFALSLFSSSCLSRRNDFRLACCKGGSFLNHCCWRIFNVLLCDQMRRIFGFS